NSQVINTMLSLKMLFFDPSNTFQNRMTIYIKIMKYIEGFNSVNYSLKNSEFEILQAIKHSNITIHDRRFSCFPRDLYFLEIRHLSLSGSSITKIDNISQLSTLTILDVSNNMLQGLPKSIGKLRNLECLTVNFNKI